MPMPTTTSFAETFSAQTIPSDLPPLPGRNVRIVGFQPGIGEFHPLELDEVHWPVLERLLEMGRGNGQEFYVIEEYEDGLPALVHVIYTQPEAPVRRSRPGTRTGRDVRESVRRHAGRRETVGYDFSPDNQRD